MKFAFVHKDEHAAIKALDELIGFLAEMVMEDYPHSHTEVCHKFKDREVQWGDVKMVLDDMKNPDTTLQVNSDHHFFFNKQDITFDIHNLVDDYVKQNWESLGFKYGKALLDAAAHEAELFLQ